MSGSPEMEPERRRLLPRQFADWRGRYLIEGDQDQRWRECRVVDISSGGAGLELVDTTVGEVEGHRIALGLQLIGTVRHTETMGSGRVRVGTEFVAQSDEERAFMAALERLNARW
jgi:PilZ domain